MTNMWNILSRFTLSLLLCHLASCAWQEKAPQLDPFAAINPMQKFNPLAPFGGYKQSGVGRELGLFGLEEYFQVKSIAR